MSGLTHNIQAQFITAVLRLIGVTLEINCNAYRQLLCQPWNESEPAARGTSR
jgi:hypothetical protein